MREKVFRNSSGFRFNVSFVDCTSVFVKSVLLMPWRLIKKDAAAGHCRILGCLPFDRKFRKSRKDGKC